MIKITEITDDAKQVLTFIGENKEEIKFFLNFMPTQNSWTFGIEYLDFKLYGCRLLNSPNLLRNYKNLLPFGIACIVEDGTDPFFIDDFSTGRVQIQLLNSTDIETIEELFT